MRVLITRPEPGAIAFADRLVKLGHHVVSEPILFVSQVEHSPDLPSDLAAIVFTSANAVRCFGGECAKVPVFVPGAATASVAEEHGWTDLRVAGGNATSLLMVIRKTLEVGCGTILHLMGRDIAVDVRRELTSRGYTVEARMVYQATPPPIFPARAARQLASGEIDAALFFSARTAIVFGLLLTPEIRTSLKRVRALALSKRIASELPENAFASVEVAERPDSDAMLELLERSS